MRLHIPWGDVGTTVCIHIKMWCWYAANVDESWVPGDEPEPVAPKTLYMPPVAKWVQVEAAGVSVTKHFYRNWRGKRDDLRRIDVCLCVEWRMKEEYL